MTVISSAASLPLNPKTQTITRDQPVTLTAVKDQFGALRNPALIWTGSPGSLSPSKTSAVLAVDADTKSPYRSGHAR